MTLTVAAVMLLTDPLPTVDSGTPWPVTAAVAFAIAASAVVSLMGARSVILNRKDAAKNALDQAKADAVSDARKDDVAERTVSLAEFESLKAGFADLRHGMQERMGELRADGIALQDRVHTLEADVRDCHAERDRVVAENTTLRIENARLAADRGTGDPP